MGGFEGKKWKREMLYLNYNLNKENKKKRNIGQGKIFSSFSFISHAQLDLPTTIVCFKLVFQEVLISQIL